MNNDEFNYDHLVAVLIHRCLDVMRDYPTKTKMTVCYNLTERILRLFCVQGEREDVLKLIDDFHLGLKESVEELYER